MNILRLNVAHRTWPEWVTLAARIILGGILIVAGGLKIPHLDASIQAVRLYQILPWELTSFVGVALPIIEVAIGLLLVTGLFTRFAAILGSLLMLAFIAGIVSVWVRGISIDCGCFGGGEAIDASLTQYPWEILRDTALLACGAWAVWRPKAPLSVDQWLFRPADEVDES